MKTKKQKIEIEVEIPEGQEFDKFEPLICTTLNGDIAFTGIVKLKPIEPSLELESGLFEEMGRVDRDLIFLARQDQAIKFSLTDYELSFSAARDLAKILNYWAEKGKLPERVLVKSDD